MFSVKLGKEESSVNLVETIIEHQSAISDIHGTADVTASCDELGTVALWAGKTGRLPPACARNFKNSIGLAGLLHSRIGSIAMYRLIIGLSKLGVLDASRGRSEPCTSLRVFNDLVCVAMATGYIRIFNVNSLTLKCEVTAHARWITALDIAPETGLLVSGELDGLATLCGYVKYLPRDTAAEIAG